MVCASSITLVASMTWVAPTIWVASKAWLIALDYTAISLIEMNRFYNLHCFYDLCSVYGLKMLYDKFTLHIVISMTYVNLCLLYFYELCHTYGQTANMMYFTFSAWIFQWTSVVPIPLEIIMTCVASMMCINFTKYIGTVSSVALKN